MIHVGMSGFSYPEWIGDVYPPGTKREGMLAAYARIFDAVEINMSFRRTPEESTLDRWRDTVPGSFSFSLKANQRITHWRKLVDVGDDAAMFVDRVRRLGERLGPLLFQIPPAMTFDPDVMKPFGASLPPGPDYAFEPRHASFMEPGAIDLLREHGIALCLNDDLFDPSAYTVTGPVAYFRFHRDSYSPEDIAERVQIVRKIEAGGTDVYAFFAHEDNPESVRPALRMRDALAEL